jgi:tetratricopeptide (TPR) repeat protein
MAINFVRQYYDDFGKIEDKIVEEKDKIASSSYKAPDNVELLFLNKVRGLIDNNRYEEAEATLLNALDAIPDADARIYFELAKVQKKLKNFYKAEDSFRLASELNPKDANIWREWIDMEYDLERYNIALHLTKKALEKTNNDVRLVIQRMGILKHRDQVDLMREEINKYLDIYDKEGRQGDYLRLLRYWKATEHNLFIETPIQPKYYFEAVEMLIEKEIDVETGIELCREALEIANKIGKTDKKSSFERKLKNLERKAMKNIHLRIRNLNRLFNNKNYSAAKKEAIMILNFPYEDKEFEKYEDYLKNALRVLLQIFASEKDYDRVKSIFEEYKLIGFKDKNCVEIYERAKKEKKLKEKNEIIEKIMFNIQECEVKLRQLIMWSLDNKEEELVELVKNKNKGEWINQWQSTKDRGLKEVSLIHYSDLSHLRSILSWVKSRITNKIQDNSKKDQIKKLLEDIVKHLENHISKERNESFHSRLQLYEIEELNGFLVDTGRTLEAINKIMELIEH